MNPILRVSEDGLRRLRAASTADRLIVVSLSAAWCRTCDEVHAALEHIAAARPDLQVVWLDIEDDAALCGDVDVETFPTFVVLRGRRIVHFGATPPQEGVMARLFDELARSGASPAVPDEVQALRIALVGNP